MNRSTPRACATGATCRSRPSWPSPPLRLRLRYLWQRLWPSRDYMAYLYGRPDLGYWGLIGIRVRTALRRLLGLKVSGS